MARQRRCAMAWSSGIDATPRKKVRAFAWTQAGGLIDLGLVPGSTESFAFDTDKGLVVGQLSGPSVARAPSSGPLRRGLRAITPDDGDRSRDHRSPMAASSAGTSLRTRTVEYFCGLPERGLVDVTPRGLNGVRPVGIDAPGRIAILFEDENPLNTRSFVLVPRGL